MVCWALLWTNDQHDLTAGEENKILEACCQVCKIGRNVKHIYQDVSG